MAMAQNLGHNVYLRPDGLFSSGGINAPDVFHEAQHNFLHKGDAPLAQQLGLPKGSGSSDINPALHTAHCF